MFVENPYVYVVLVSTSLESWISDMISQQSRALVGVWDQHAKKRCLGGSRRPQKLLFLAEAIAYEGKLPGKFSFCGVSAGLEISL